MRLEKKSWEVFLYMLPAAAAQVTLNDLSCNSKRFFAQRLRKKLPLGRHTHGLCWRRLSINTLEEALDIPALCQLTDQAVPSPQPEAMSARQNYNGIYEGHLEKEIQSGVK